MSESTPAAVPLSTLLSQPLTSTSQLLSLLIPPLDQLQLIPDLPQLSERYSTTESTIDPTRFLKRQLGLVQQVLIDEKVWEDWEQAILMEEGRDGLVVLERWYIPPSASTTTTEGGRRFSENGGKIALSSYAVLSSLLSLQRRRTTTNDSPRLPIQPRSLEIVSNLLVKLSKVFNIEEVYRHTLAYTNPHPSSSSRRSSRSKTNIKPRISSSVKIEEVSNSSSDSSSEDSEDDETEIDPTALMIWEQSIRDMIGIPTRVANAWGKMGEMRGGMMRKVEGLPKELEVEIYLSTMIKTFLSLLSSLASHSPPSSTSPENTNNTQLTPSIYPSTLSIPLQHFISTSQSIDLFLSLSIPTILTKILPQNETFPIDVERLLERQRYKDLWKRMIDGLDRSELDRKKLISKLISKIIVDSKRIKTQEEDSGRKIKIAKGISFLLESLFGPLSLDTDNRRSFVEVLFDRNHHDQNWDSEVVSKVMLYWLKGGTNTGAKSKEEKETVLKREVGMLEEVVKVWSGLEEMKNGFESRRIYLTILLLSLIVSLPLAHESIITLSRSPRFLRAISSSLSTISPLSRYLGMLVAEIVSNRSIQGEGGVEPLDFGKEVWDGEGVEKDKIREIRKFVKAFQKEDDEEESCRREEGWKEILWEIYGGGEGEGETREEEKKIHESIRSSQTPIVPTSIEEPIETTTIETKKEKKRKPLISIIGSDDEDEQEEDLEPQALPPGPSRSTLEALSSTDPSLYQSAYPTTSSIKQPQTRRRGGKLRPPVYIAELTAYLNGRDPEGGKEEADGEAERVEMGLKEGERLVRRKSGWGNELKENAVNLAFALMAMQDNYEIDGFEQLRQGMLVALIVGCPVEVAPCVIEQYFMPSYSISQLHTLLTALALAARELANLPTPSLPTPSSSPAIEHPLFPSKQLPPGLHRRLIASQQQQQSNDQLQLLSADLANLALSDAREDAETTVPGAARERLLSVRKFQTKKPTSLASSSRDRSTSTPPFTKLCAEYFILPLVNRFWLFLRDAATSTIYQPSSSSSKGSYMGGTTPAQILKPLLLSRYLSTLSILVNASRNAPTFLAVIVPETLALVLSLRPPPSSSSTYVELDDETTDEMDPGKLDQELVVSSQLELILVLLSTSHSIDRGYTLTRDSRLIQLVMECQSWAEEVFEGEERKQGGAAMGRAGRSAAGILLRVDEILGKWRGRVGWE